MKFYEQHLLSKNIEVNYIDSQNLFSDARELIPHLRTNAVSEIVYVDTTDNWLELRLNKAAQLSGILLKKLPTPLFLNSSEELINYFSDKKRN
jgi:deoxyribodipyrimidine photolyase-related protein